MLSLCGNSGVARRKKNERGGAGSPDGEQPVCSFHIVTSAGHSPGFTLDYPHRARVSVTSNTKGHRRTVEKGSKKPPRPPESANPGRGRESWEQLRAGVAPLPGRLDRVSSPAPLRPKHVRRQPHAFEVTCEEEWVQGERGGSGGQFLRSLRGLPSVPPTLDLHGMRQKEALAHLTRFVQAHFRHGARIVCVVHGKGRHSERGYGVLKKVITDAIVNGPLQEAVVAFKTAPAKFGGTGAMLLRLASAPRLRTSDRKD